MTYDKTNFHKHTFCTFVEVNGSEIISKPDFVSKSGSRYFYSIVGVYRESHHWGRAANCKWSLRTTTNTHKGRIKIGFAKWCDFFAIDDTSKIFWIDHSQGPKKLRYRHHRENDYAGENLYSAPDIMRIIRKLRKQNR